MNLPFNQIICGNALDVLKTFPDSSIDCVITSPPYWGLREYPSDAEIIWAGNPDCAHEWVKHVKPKERGGYGENSWRRPSRDHEAKWRPQLSSFCTKCGAWYGQLGLEPSPELYIDHLIMIFREIYRVLKPTGTFWLNIGDTYAGSNCGRNDYRKKTMIGVDTSRYQKTSPQSRVTYKRKSLMLIPERLVLRLVDEVGFILRNKIIWYKPNHMPNSVKDRLTNTWEYVYLLVKKPRYYFNLDAIRVPHTSLRDIRRLKKHGGLNVRLTFRKKWNGQKTQSAFIAMNPNGKNPGDIIGTKHDIAVGRIGRYSYSDPLHVKDYHPKGKNPGDTINSKYMDEQIHVYAPAWKKYAPRTTHENESNLGDYWPMTTEPFKDAHFAVFPKKLIVPMILAGCPPNGIVLDPFMGSGTVAVVVELINRGLWDDLNYEPNKIAKKIKWNLKWIGIEIVKEYVDMAYRRLHPLRNYTLIEEIFGLKKMVCIG